MLSSDSKNPRCVASQKPKSVVMKKNDGVTMKGRGDISWNIARTWKDQYTVSL